MKFNKYSHLEGAHAFLSPSQYHWVNYDLEKLENTYHRRQASLMGTRIHSFADECISLGIKLPDEPKTLNMYVNDAIDLGMAAEVMLYYSDNSFGTTDTILFKDNFLRIHDLKTGVTRASMKQLEVYTALFCLEYDIDENTIDIELRIYQGDEVICYVPDKEDISFIIDKIQTFDKRIDEIRMEG